MRRSIATMGGGLAVAGVLVTAGCGFMGGQDHEGTSFDAPGERLVVDTNYDITLATADGDELEVERWVRGGADAAWSMDGETLKLRVEQGPFGFGEGSRSEVRVPEGLPVVVRTGNGDVTAEGLVDGVEVEGTNGDITVSEATGAVSVVSTNGDVHIESVEPLDQADVRTVNGDVSMELGGDADYRVDVETGNGDADVSVDENDESERHLSVESTNGDVTIEQS